MSVSVRMSVCLSVCLSVSLSACISQKPHAKTSLNFLNVLFEAVARSSSDDSGIRYVLPVVWMTSRFLIMDSLALDVGSIDLRAVLDTK